MNKKHFNHLLSVLLSVTTLFGILAVPTSAASLKDSGSVWSACLAGKRF